MTPCAREAAVLKLRKKSPEQTTPIVDSVHFGRGLVDLLEECGLDRHSKHFDAMWRMLVDDVDWLRSRWNQEPG